MIFMPLTIKQQKFVDAYMATNGNGVESARQAGYKGDDRTLRNVASENLTKPNIGQAIRERQMEQAKSFKITAGMVLQKLWSIAEVSSARVPRVDKESGEPMSDADGNPLYRVNDGATASKSLELIGRHLGMFVDRTAVSLEEKETVPQDLVALKEQFAKVNGGQS